MSKAFVQKQAPEFEAEAVLPNGQFGKVKLSDYKGKWLFLLLTVYLTLAIGKVEIVLINLSTNTSILEIVLYLLSLKECLKNIVKWDVLYYNVITFIKLLF